MRIECPSCAAGGETAITSMLSMGWEGESMLGALIEMAQADCGPGDCADDIQPFGTDELLVLTVAIALALLTAALLLRRDQSGALTWLVAGTLLVEVIAFVWINDSDSPFGTDELLLTVANVIFLAALIVRWARSNRARAPS